MTGLGDYLQDLGELVCAAKDRDLARRDQEAAVNSAHDSLFRKIRAIEKSHDDLLAALKRAESALRSIGWPDGDLCHDPDAAEHADEAAAAIAKAEQS